MTEYREHGCKGTKVQQLTCKFSTTKKPYMDCTNSKGHSKAPGRIDCENFVGNEEKDNG